ncbi:MAG: malto-oligosyltrehalose trehalohydrolase [Achromobacter sp.]
MSTFVPTYGATAQPDGTTTFRFWAPNAAQVDVVIDDGAPAPMTREANGDFVAQAPCGAGARYRFRIDGDLAVPDPASRLQDGDVHDASLVTAPDAFAWQHTDWRGRPFEETVLYELHPGLCGGFTGIAERLPALAALGITAVELMPIADFPGARNWGYDGVLPYAPDTAYGTPDDLKRMIDTAHGLGLMVFLDVVYNHFGPDGNYLNAYARDFFTEDTQTPWGPAIDFRKDPVRKFFAENALYWLSEYRFDGLRLDAVHAIAEPEWLPEMAAFVRSHIGDDRQVHLVLENDDNIASHMENGFDAQWNDDAHHVVHHLLTGETNAYYIDYADAPAEKLARVLGEGFVFQGEPSKMRKGEPRGTPSHKLRPTAFVLFLQNHDQVGNRAMGERLISLAPPDHEALHAAVAMQLLCPHIPLIFMGEERGVDTPFLYFTSHTDAELVKAVREGRRREFAGLHEFEDEAAQARIPDPNESSTYERSRDDEAAGAPDASTWLDLYRHLLGLRRTRIAPHLAGATSLGAQVLGSHAVSARWLLGDGSTLAIFTNLGTEPVTGEKLSDDYDAEAEVLFESRAGADAALRSVKLLAGTTVALLRAPSAP